MNQLIVSIPTITLLLILVIPASTNAATFTVDSSADDIEAHDINPGNGLCADTQGSCTLRAAIEEANATAALDVILFADNLNTSRLSIAAGEGPLPAIINRLYILGTSIGSYNNSATLLRNAPPQFTIDGNQLSSVGYDGLYFYGASASGSIVSGLSIINFPGSGITVGNGANNVVIERNYIGVRPDGVGAGNGLSGIQVSNSDNVQIGKSRNNGSFGGLGNVISNNGNDGIRLFNSDNALILGNLIGISPSGTGDLGNGYYGIKVTGNSNQIGDVSNTGLAGNFVAGNSLGGIHLSGSYNLIYANQLGKGETGGFISSEGNGIEVIGTYNRIGDFSGKGNKVYEHLESAIKMGNDGGNLATDKANLNWTVGNIIGSSGQTTSILRSGNGQGINLDNGNSNIIELNRVINSVDIGIRVRGNGNNIVRNHVGYVDKSHGIQGAEPNRIGLDLDGDGNFVGAIGFSNYFSGNLESGAILRGANIFRYNFVGVSSDYTPIPNGLTGVVLSQANTPTSHNVIGAHGFDGIWVSKSQGFGITNNLIGIDPNGNNIGNGRHGIRVTGSADSHSLDIDISNNTIAFNGGYGIATSPDHVSGVQWQNNVMHHNLSGGADIGSNGATPNDFNDIDEGSNRGQNYPEITFVSFTPGGGGPLLRAQFSIPTPAAAAAFPLQVALYWSDVNEAAQGHYFIGAYAYPTPSAFQTQGDVLPQGLTHGWLTAVVKDADGNSSEFMPAVMFGEQSDILFSDSFEDE